MRTVRIGVALLVCAVAGAAVGWAARQVFSPVSQSEEAPSFAVVTVMDGDVGSSLAVTASAVWSTDPLGINEAIGTVTTLSIEPGEPIEAGDDVYSVNEQRVIVLSGAVPAYRSLAAPAEGEDVRQLQAYLHEQGYLGDHPDGVFGPVTAAAVRSWQRDLGAPVTGTVPLGSIVFLPELPARARLNDDLRVGDRLSGGEALLEVYPSSPRFDVPLAPGQADAISPGMSAQVEAEGHVWPAIVERVDQLDDGTLLASLVGPEGGPVCGSDCGDVPVEGRVTFPASIELVPSVTGPMVPVAALVTAADGGYQVVSESGARLDVDIVAQGGGYAVIGGIAIGARLRVPGE